MTTIVIIGILSTVAIPSYAEYVKKARMAEMYTTVEAIQKAQIKHFYENGYFVPGIQYVPSNGYLPSKGSKAILIPTPGVNYNTLEEPAKSVIAAFYAPLMSSLPTGEGYYFAYGTYSAFFHPDGNPSALGFNGNTGEVNYGIAIGGTEVGANFSIASGVNCGLNLSYDQLSIDQTPGDWYSVVSGATNDSDDECTMGLQVTVVHNGDFQNRPLIVAQGSITSK